ncbi:hypothetical protein SUGI_0348980 [Cryptomeria japonica]|nr:hypothetical protein SUGI_0348980 [Cryptomeria japonica]
MAQEYQRELRVVMFPWLAHGHITPFLELAKSLATHGLKIFFVSTSLNIKRIKPEVLDAPGIEMVELAMPSVEGLPPGVESSADAANTGEAPLRSSVATPLTRLCDPRFCATLGSSYGQSHSHHILHHNGSDRIQLHGRAARHHT